MPASRSRVADVQSCGHVAHRFWQRGGGYDPNLRGVRDIHEKVRYIHQNPVRRGLVKHAIYWKWSSAAAWQTGCDEPLAIDRASFPALTVLDDRVDSTLMGGQYLS